MGGFVVTMVYGFSRATADLDVLEIAPAAAGRSMLELGMQGVGTSWMTPLASVSVCRRNPDS